MISFEELDDRKNQVVERLMRNFVESGFGLLYQDSEDDKYTFEHEAKVINQDLIEKINPANSKIYAISKLRSNGGEARSPLE